MTATNIRVLIIDNHEIVREGVRLILQAAPDLTVVGTAADGESGTSLAQRLAGRGELDVVVTEMGLPDIGGLEVTRRLKASHPAVRVLILSMHTDDEHIRGMLASGADGYLLKQEAVQDLTAAVRAVARGETALSPLVARRMMSQLREVRTVEATAKRLTVREREVLELMAGGATTKEIARRYHCQPKTVENHRGRILEKLRVNNTPAAISLGYQRGLINVSAVHAAA